MRVYISKTAQEVTFDDWDKVIDINLKGAYFIEKYALNYFVTHKVQGKIINIVEDINI